MKILRKASIILGLFSMVHMSQAMEPAAPPPNLEELKNLFQNGNMLPPVITPQMVMTLKNEGSLVWRNVTYTLKSGADILNAKIGRFIGSPEPMGLVNGLTQKMGYSSSSTGIYVFQTYAAKAVEDSIGSKIFFGVDTGFCNWIVGGAKSDPIMIEHGSASGNPIPTVTREELLFALKTLDLPELFLENTKADISKLIVQKINNLTEEACRSKDTENAKKIATQKAEEMKFAFNIISLHQQRINLEDEKVEKQKMIVEIDELKKKVKELSEKEKNFAPVIGQLQQRQNRNPQG